MKWGLFVICLWSFWGAQAQHDPDSVIKIVWNALSAEETYIEESEESLLVDCDWEALSYWDTKSPKNMSNMFEAVGDVYRFNKDGSFLLRLIDPSNPKTFGLEVKGSYVRKAEIISLTSEAGKLQHWQIVFLDQNYLILEIDGLRIFFTKSISYYTY